MKTITVDSLEKMGKYAQDFISALLDVGRKSDRATVVALSGDLGSGKTAFVQAVARMLGIQETVTSPTFIIEKIYSLPTGNPQHVHSYTHLIHIDAYRLESARELTHLGWKEIVADPHNLLFIEWPEKVGGMDILAPEAIKLSFKFINEHTREISR